MMTVTTNNDTEMVSMGCKLNEKLQNDFADVDSTLIVDNIHVRCLPHTVNL